MDKKDDSGCTFPMVAIDQNREIEPWIDGGMSLRDYFAGQNIGHLAAMYGRGHEKAAAEHSYRVADAMLKARGGGDA